MITVKLARSAV